MRPFSDMHGPGRLHRTWGTPGRGNNGCDAVAPELARLSREGRDKGLNVVVIGRGDPEENRRKSVEYGFTFPVALQKRWEVSKSYGIE